MLDILIDDCHLGLSKCKVVINIHKGHSPSQLKEELVTHLENVIRTLVKERQERKWKQFEDTIQKLKPCSKTYVSVVHNLSNKLSHQELRILEHDDTTPREFISALEFIFNRVEVEEPEKHAVKKYRQC